MFLVCRHISKCAISYWFYSYPFALLLTYNSVEKIPTVLSGYVTVPHLDSCLFFLARLFVGMVGGFNLVWVKPPFVLNHIV